MAGGWTQVIPDSITLPPSAGPGDARFVIGPDVPIELRNYYVTNVPTAAIVYYDASGAYYYIAFLDLGIVVYGWVNLGAVCEIRSEETGVYNDPSNPTNMFIGIDPLSYIDIFNGAQPPGAAACNVRQYVNGASVSRLMTAANELATGTPAGALFTNSAAFVNLAVPAAFTFEKQYGNLDTQLRVRMTGTAYTSNLGTGMQFGVHTDDGTLAQDTQIARVDAVLTANAHTTIAGTKNVTGHGHGPITVTARWRRSGAANNINMDASDYLDIEVWEVHR